MFQPINNRAPWSGDDLATLQRLIGLELPMRTIARKLNRSEEAVRQKAHRLAMANMRRVAADQLNWPAGR